jgi:hypothetical protein
LHPDRALWGKHWTGGGSYANFHAGNPRQALAASATARVRTKLQPLLNHATRIQVIQFFQITRQHGSDLAKRGVSSCRQASAAFSALIRPCANVLRQTIFPHILRKVPRGMKVTLKEWPGTYNTQIVDSPQRQDAHWRNCWSRTSTSTADSVRLRRSRNERY